MTAVKVAINGFGRIGRSAFKIAWERGDIEVVAVNDLTDTKTLAYLLKHDSNYGTYEHDVTYDEASIIIDGKPVRVLAEKDPAVLPWGEKVSMWLSSRLDFSPTKKVLASMCRLVRSAWLSVVRRSRLVWT